MPQSKSRISENEAELDAMAKMAFVGAKYKQVERIHTTHLIKVIVLFCFFVVGVILSCLLISATNTAFVVAGIILLITSFIGTALLFILLRGSAIKKLTELQQEIRTRFPETLNNETLE